MIWTDELVIEFARANTQGGYGDYNGCKTIHAKLQRFKELHSKRKMVKETRVEYTEDYGGIRAFTFQRFINGRIVGDPYSHGVIKRESIMDLHTFIIDEITSGYSVTFLKQNKDEFSRKIN